MQAAPPTHPLLRAFDRILEFTGTLVGVVLALVATFIVADIFIRYFNFGSLPWVIEMTEYMMYAGTFLAAPWALRHGAHVRVDIVLTSVSARNARRLERFINLVGLFASTILVIYGIQVVVDAYQSHAIAYKTWNYPEWIILMPIPIAGLLLGLEFILRFFRVGAAAPAIVDITEQTRL